MALLQYTNESESHLMHPHHYAVDRVSADYSPLGFAIFESFDYFA
ncbi:hypothetical protein RLPCCGM1_p1964 [Rhizobium leguminosarum bv. phaseoli CCGM1]|nr:hypothetical protein RLPCCGM1_p1964 [Rhizobium leguminosarum bv. phaseoli CCGM1]